MTAYPSISDPNKFENWMTDFKHKSSYKCAKGSQKTEAIKCPINDTLKAIQSIPVECKSSKILELNLLYACFMATNAHLPEQDIRAVTRRELLAAMDQLPATLKTISSLLFFLEEHRPMALKAVAQTDDPKVHIDLQTIGLSSTRLERLTSLLLDLKDGLLEFQDDPDHPALISSSDFQYGPFEFDFDLNVNLKHKGTKLEEEGKNIIHTGLMFHLTYLFRYFTRQLVPKTSPAFFNGDILMLDMVRMIKVGKPYGQHVAALVNAVFNEKYSTRNVKDRLDSLYKTTPGSKTKKNPVFIGW